MPHILKVELTLTNTQNRDCDYSEENCDFLNKINTFIFMQNFWELCQCLDIISKPQENKKKFWKEKNKE